MMMLGDYCSCRFCGRNNRKAHALEYSGGAGNSYCKVFPGSIQRLEGGAILQH